MGVYIRENRGRLYIDIYWGGKRVWEKTGLTVPRDPAARREVYQLAEKIRLKREMQLVSREHDIQDLVAARQSLISYAEAIAEGQDSQNPLPRSLKYLREYAGNISINEISEKWVGGYRDFLLQQSSLGSNTQSRYLASLRRVLNQALRENLLPRSLTRNLKPIKEQEPDTEFLNADEVAILGATPLPPGIPEDIRRAFLFSCFVGLRVSDLQSLTWGMIDRSAHEIQKRQKKTRRFIVVPIKDSAWALIDDGIFHRQDEKVFPCLHDEKGSTNRLLQRWAKKANIPKRLTWHVARRTFGTLALRSGADLATVSKLLGHTSIAYTQRYLKVDSASVQVAINAMPEIDLIAKAGKVIPIKRAEGEE